MNRLRRWSVLAVVLTVSCLSVPVGRGQPPAPKDSGEKWLVDRAMSVSPRPEPVPALKYRLLPLASELKEGNAVPIYLRLIHEQRDESRKQWTETPQKWNDLPLDQLPLNEARHFVDGVRKRFLDQFDYGARRKSADWNYTIEQPDPISILLPDVQQMRQYAPMMILRARVDVADGKYDAAARSFETGFAFSRHVANGPFLINGLVGLAIANQFADRIPEWIERPDAPNLYWSLTALPRPLIDLRNQMEFEQKFFEMQFPEVADVDRPRSAAEWDAALKRFRIEAKRVDPLLATDEGKKKEHTPTATDPDEPAAQSRDLDMARKFVAVRQGKSADEVAKMPPAQVLMVFIVGSIAERRDDLFKTTYLPFPQAHPLLPDAVKRLKAAGDDEGNRLAKAFLPAIAKAMTRHAQLGRKIAALRTVEALRLHAAAHGGQLPDALDQVTAAPVPLDPGTGKPFEYTRDGPTATIVSRIRGEPLETTGLRYRVTVRGK
jgi:hypothetical protein